ncbi:NUMOD4 motif-containing HNH endonuclease [Staphylococcus pseudoxylosus]|uniref:NUMOD4 motif-containing HNH endonuclease n=1 Tax=Staphylococcus pseudoxylosus TaxID=2282419 RepID=UPI003016A335
MVEIWKPISNYENKYEVSSLGRVRSLDRTFKRNGIDVHVRKRVLKAYNTKRGLTTVCLHDKGKQKTFKVHHLVALSFIGERPPGYQICHKNGNASDNRLDNLKYDTVSQNKIDCYRYGGKHGNGKLTIENVLNIRKLYSIGNYTQRELAVMFGVNQRAVFNIVNRKTFKYLNLDGSIEESETSIGVI